MGEGDVPSRFGSRLATRKVPRRPCLKSHRGERGVSHHPLFSEAPRALRPRDLFVPRQGNTRRVTPVRRFRSAIGRNESFKVRSDEPQVQPKPRKGVASQ